MNLYKEKKDMTLFSNDTKDCLELEKRLKEKGVDFTVNKDIVLMKERCFLALPKLEDKGKVMGYKEALSYLERV